MSLISIVPHQLSVEKMPTELEPGLFTFLCANTISTLKFLYEACILQTIADSTEIGRDAVGNVVNTRSFLLGERMAAWLGIFPSMLQVPGVLLLMLSQSPHDEQHILNYGPSRMSQESPRALVSPHNSEKQEHEKDRNLCDVPYSGV